MYYLFMGVFMNRLKDLREDRDLLQKDFINIFNLSKTGYAQYENEINDIPTNMLCNFSNYYKTSIDYILCRSDIHKPYSKSNISRRQYQNRIKFLRKAKNESQAHISKIINVTQSTLSKYELEKSDISTDLLCALADYYNTSTDYLLFNTDDIKAHDKSPFYKEKIKRETIHN